MEIHQPDPLGASAHGSNGPGFQADQFPLGGDEDDSRILAHLHDRHHLPVSIGGLHVDDALASSGLIAIGADPGALPVTVLGDRQDQAFIPTDRHAYQIVASHQIDALDTASLPPHGSHASLVEANTLALSGAQENLIVSRGQLGADQLISFVQGDRTDSPGHRVAEGIQAGLFDRSPPRGKHHELILGKLGDRQQGSHLLALFEVDQVDDGLAFAAAPHIRDHIDLEPVDLPLIGEYQQIAVG